MLSACESSARSAELPGAKGRGPGRLIAGLALVLSFAACGSDDGSPAIKGGGKGTAYGLRAAGLVRCAGPVRGRGGASVSLYASGGFAAVLAIGPAATDDAIALAGIRTGGSNDPNAKHDAAVRERAWRRTAMDALEHADTPCASGLARLPVLAETEVPCYDEILIPLGERRARNKFISVLRTLYHVNVKLVLKGNRNGPYGYSRGHYEQQVSTNHPYCRKP